MGLLDGFEKLINEHGSAVILKERIELANDKYSLLEEKNSVLEEKIKNFEAKNQKLTELLQEAESKLKELSKQDNCNPDGYVCDHCGSPSLTRTGSRPDPTFGELGIKQELFRCDDCAKKSAFTPKQ